MKVGIPRSSTIFRCLDINSDDHHTNGEVDVVVVEEVHKHTQSANSTLFNAGKMVLPISNAYGRGQNGARNFNHASIPDIHNTNPNHNVVTTTGNNNSWGGFDACRSSLGRMTFPISIYTPNNARFMFFVLPVLASTPPFEAVVRVIDIMVLFVFFLRSTVVAASLQCRR